MKKILILIFLISRVLVTAAEDVDLKPSSEPTAATTPSPTPVPQPLLPQAPRAWLGFEVSKPDASTSAQLPALPPGIGFLVRSIQDGSPAQVAGVQKDDILWKLGDQMLVNEGQLAALLRLSKPGDEVILSGFRAGQPLEVKIKLGQTPLSQRRFPRELVDSSLLPGACGGPMRVINVAEKLATYSTDEGRAEVRKVGDTYKVKIQGPKEELIFQGDLAANENLDSIPDPWKHRIHALRRGLDMSLESRALTTRQPRPRIVPPNAGNP